MRSRATMEALRAITLELRALILQINALEQRVKAIDELHGHQLAEILEAVHFPPQTEGTK